MYADTSASASIHSTLRPHQVRLIGEIDRALRDGCLRIMAQAPTGFGKTMVAAALAKRGLVARRRTIFTVPVLSLIDQTVDKFFAEDITDLGVIQANHPMTNYARRVQLASVLTLRRREMPPADLVIIDEAHRWFDSYEEWLHGRWKDIPVIGLSATPWTRGLGKYFDKLLIGATTEELIGVKYLSPFRVFAPAGPDLTDKFKVKFGDWPRGLDHLTGLPPTRSTLGWIRSRQIAYSKAMKGASWR